MASLPAPLAMLSPVLICHILSFTPKHLELRSVCRDWNAYICSLHHDAASLSVCQAGCHCSLLFGQPIHALKQALLRLPWMTSFVYCSGGRGPSELQSELQQHILCLSSSFSVAKTLIIKVSPPSYHAYPPVLQFANWCREVSSPQLTIVLDVINWLSFRNESDFKAFFESPGMEAIHACELSLHQSQHNNPNNIMPSSVMHSFFASRTISNLSKLKFSFCNIFDLAACTALASSPYLTQLTNFSFCRSELEGMDQDDRCAFYKTLLSAPSLCNLTSLSIRIPSDSSLPADALEALAKCPLRTSLRSLDLIESNVTAAGLYHILTSRYFTKLRELCLDGNENDLFYEYPVSRVISNPALFTLTSLQVLKIEGTFTPIRTPALIALLKSPILKSVTHLYIASNSLNDKCLSIIRSSSSSHLRRLEFLDVTNNPVTINGLLQFLSPASASSLPNLHTICVHTIHELYRKWPSIAKIALKFKLF